MRREAVTELTLRGQGGGPRIRSLDWGPLVPRRILDGWG
jgi:hypothetical protein